MGSDTAWRPGPVGASCARDGSGVVSGYRPDLADPGSGHVRCVDPSGPAGEPRAADGDPPGRGRIDHSPAGGVLRAARRGQGRRSQPHPAPTAGAAGGIGRRRSTGTGRLAPHRPSGPSGDVNQRSRDLGVGRGGNAHPPDGESLNMADLQGFSSPDPHGVVAARGPSPAARAAGWLVRMYQSATVNRPSPCRYVPTCSSYALDAYEVHGFVKGSWLSLRRIGRCHPWGRQGWDPVPDRHGHLAPEPGSGHPATPTSDPSPSRRRSR
jgi:uncharacterized protein